MNVWLRTPEGGAVSARHIVHLYVHHTDKGYVVRCDTVLKEGEFVNSGGTLNLSRPLADKEHASLWLGNVIDFITKNSSAETPQK